MTANAVAEPVSFARRSVRLASHADQYRVDQSNITIFKLQLEQLLAEGTLLDVDVKGLSMLHSAVSWDDLGIPKDDRRAKRFTRGRKSTYPNALVGPMLSCEERARRNLLQHSSIVDGFRGWRYVTAEAYWGDLTPDDDPVAVWEVEKEKERKDQRKLGWRGRQLVLEHEFAKHRARLLLNIPLARVEARLDFIEVGLESVDAMLSRRTGLPTLAAIPPGADITQERYLKEDMKQVAGIPKDQRYTDPGKLWNRWLGDPTATQGATETIEEFGNRVKGLRARLGERSVVQQVFVFWLSEKALGQMVSADEIMAQTQMRYITGMLEDQRETEAIVLEATQLKAKTAEIDAENWKIRAMKEEELKKAVEQLNATTSPILQVIQQFESGIYEEVTRLQSMVKEKGTLPGKAADSIVRLREALEMLAPSNYTSRADLNKLIAKLEASVAERPNGTGKKTKGPKYNATRIAAALQDIADFTLDSAKSMVSTSSGRFAFLELDRPDDEI
jgi:hypothetical protein